MKKFLKRLLGPMLTRLASNASAPNRNDVHKSLSLLLEKLESEQTKKGVNLHLDFAHDKIIIFSDHHKGNKDHGDDFLLSEPNYLAALEYYLDQNFTYINLGDSEELWKYSPDQVIPKNLAALSLEAKFQAKEQYYKTFGNHDITWKNKMHVDKWFKDTFMLPLPVYEGLLLKATIDGQPLSVFVTHGHQGDKMSDNNSLSTWLVAHVWRPVQRYLQINVNTPAKDYDLKDRHNIMMYEWSSQQKNLLLVTGHTHKPVFASGRYSDHESNKIHEQFDGTQKMILIPSYYNSGCCCYNDGDITGIEIAGGKISLVKWHADNHRSVRSVLEEAPLKQVIEDLS